MSLTARTFTVQFVEKISVRIPDDLWYAHEHKTKMSLIDLAYYLLSAQWMHDGFTFVCRKAKHVVLYYAHPFPSVLKVHVGFENDAPALIFQEMVKSVSAKVIVDMHDSCKGNTILLEENGTTHVSEFMAVIRYFGKMSRMYPTTPASALDIDSELDRIGEFVHIVCKTKELETIPPIVEEKMIALENEFDVDHVCINGFNQKTVLDICWTGLFKWLFDNNLMPEKYDEFPNFMFWWDHVRPEDDTIDMGEEEYGMEEQEDGDKTD